MAVKSIVELSDANFDQEVLQVGAASSGGFLGSLVWPL